MSTSATEASAEADAPEASAEADAPEASADAGIAEASAETGAPEASAEAAADSAGAGRNHRKVREGIVTSVAMSRTAVVSVTERVRHPRYFKTVQRTKKLYVHDPDNEARNGDRVRVMEIRPVSKTKRWRLLEIVERAR